MFWLRRGLLLVGLAFYACPALAETRIALIIGNGAYTSLPRLPNPPRDAEAMRTALQSLGFSVDLGTNLDRDAMDKAFIAFARKARTADVALVFYGGHGIQYRGINYLAPIDADVTDESDLRRFVTAQQILEDLQGASKIRILILDACRDNAVIQKLASTMPASRSAGLSRGLSRMSAPEGTLLAYSTQADAVAADGVGGNSPFTSSLVKHLSDPGLDVRIVFARARSDVFEASHHTQLPELSDSLVGEFSFTPLSATPVQPRSSPPAEQVASLEVSADPRVKTCDRLASSPFDTTRPIEFTGVEIDKIDISQAVPACRAAHDAFPNDGRISFELARALDKQDPDEAANLYRSAANSGHIISMRNIGTKYRKGNGVAKDLEAATRWYREAADGGDATSMRLLGFSYATGTGVAKDFNEAVRWYRKGAEAGDATAMADVGISYANGNGVARDPEEAVRWLRKGADGGESAAMDLLGSMYENGNGVAKDFNEAIRWYRKGADSGNARAMSDLGDMYRNGTGTSEDLGEADRWYRKGADSGDAYAMRRLGIAYAIGSGVAKHPEEAIRWFRKGADGGDATSMANLGVVYENGRGVAKDLDEAMRWYRKAVDGGDAGAMRNIGDMYESGRGVAKDTHEAVRWYRKAAAGDDAVAMRYMGYMYATGSGVDKNPEEAMRWFRKAAENGDESSKKYLKKALVAQTRPKRSRRF